MGLEKVFSEIGNFGNTKLPKISGFDDETMGVIYVSGVLLVGMALGATIYYADKFLKKKEFDFHFRKKENYFTFDELTATSKPFANTPSAEETENLQLLCEKVLNPLRKKYGKKINVSSGYRSYLVNLAVGGSSTSDHRKGMAVDIKGFDKSRAENKKLYDLIVSMGLPFKQLINEHDYQWVHVSYDKNNVKKEKLYTYQQNGKTKYAKA